MGGMLSHPVTSKMLVREGNKLYRVGRADMQGYRMNMEDAMTVLLGLGEGREDWGFFGVFDGHAGTRASAYLGEHLHHRICELADPFDAGQLIKCVNDFDAEFCADPERREDGSTCVFAIVRPANEDKTAFDLIVSNTGDSRVVIVRKDGKGVSMTHDHKPNDPPEMSRIYSAGGTVSMNRTDGQLAMSRAIGDYNYKGDESRSQTEQKVIPTPDITKETLRPGDGVLVMCDGIVEAMDNDAAVSCVVASMKKCDDPAQACADLFDRSIDCGSKDNHSAIIVMLEDGSDFGPRHQFYAGPYHPYQSDQQFAKAYISDAARYGIQGEELFKMAKKTEDEIGEFPDAARQEESHTGQQYFRLLQHIQQTYNLSSMQIRTSTDEDAEDGGEKAVAPSSE